MHANINWFRIKYKNHIVNKAIQKQARPGRAGRVVCIMRNALRLSLHFGFFRAGKEQSSERNHWVKNQKLQTILMITWIINDFFIIYETNSVGQFFLSIFTRMSFCCAPKSKNVIIFLCLRHAIHRLRSHRHWKQFYWFAIYLSQRSLFAFSPVRFYSQNLPKSKSYFLHLFVPLRQTRLLSLRLRKTFQWLLSPNTNI